MLVINNNNDDINNNIIIITIKLKQQQQQQQQQRKKAQKTFTHTHTVKTSREFSNFNVYFLDIHRNSEALFALVVSKSCLDFIYLYTSL